MPVYGDGAPLLAAAEKGKTAVVSLLLDRGANIELVVPGDENALIQASGSGRLDVVKLLVARGANVNARDLGRRTPIRRPEGRVADARSTSRAGSARTRSSRSCWPRALASNRSSRHPCNLNIG